MADDTLFTWIHLSDIHFGHGDASHRWDQKLVLDALRKDLGPARAEGAPAPDAILVTGDIAFSGGGLSPTEYADAQKWLLAMGAAVGLGPDRIFVVPGNHDVNRGADKDRNTRRLIEALRSGQDALDTALADAGDRALIAGRMRGYLDFSAGFAPACAGAPAPAEERISWVHRLTARGGLTVRLVGLNTALLSSGDPDEKKLRLGKGQLGRALLDPEIGDGELVMVLSHHPFRTGWLEPEDGKNADAWAKKSAHVHLSGHVHDAETEESRAGGASGGFVRIVAGAAHGEKQPSGDIPAGHGYSWGAIVGDGHGGLRLRIWPRHWSDHNRDFRLDVNNVPRGRAFAEHTLSLQLSSPAAVPSGPPATPPAITPPTRPAATPAAAVKAGGPLQVFISSAKQDAADLAEVETRLKLINRPYRAKGEPLLEWWSPSQVGSGEDSRATIAARLAAADIVIILVSTEALASDEIFFDEMTAAVERDKAKTGRVIPILLRLCEFGAAPFAHLEFLPERWVPKGKHDSEPRPVSTMDRDTAFLKIEQGIKAAAEKLRAERA